MIARVLLLALIGVAPLWAVEPDSQLTQDVRTQLLQDNYEIVLAGEREVAMVVSESTTPITKGVAVMIAEAGKGPLSQHGLAPLAPILNQYGWVTMLMASPSTAFIDVQNDAAMPAQAPSEQPSEDATDTGTETTSPSAPTDPAADHARFVAPRFDPERVEQHQQQLIQQLQAVVSRSQDYPGFFLVITSGTTAAWLSKIYAEQLTDLPDALVVISPFWPQRDLNLQIPALLGQTQMPVLDVFSPWDNEWSRQTIGQRQVAAQKAFKMHYRQRELIGQTLDAQQYAFLGKEIYGWLTYMGW